VLFHSHYIHYYCFVCAPPIDLTLSLHDALPILVLPEPLGPISPTTSPRCTLRLTPSNATTPPKCMSMFCAVSISRAPSSPSDSRSEEHTSELQSREKLVCRLLLEKKYDLEQGDR